MFENFIAKVLEIFTQVTNLKMILIALIIFCGYMVYLTKDSITTFAHLKVENATRSEYYIPKDLNISKENIDNIQSTSRRYMDTNPMIGMVAVYKFVPDHDTFYQGRILVTSGTQLNSKLDINKYNIKWLPISALSAQTRLILKGKVFTADIKQVITEYLKPDSEVRDEYLTPGNFSSMYLDGARYFVSVPIFSSRIIGYTTVVFDRVPLNTEEEQAFTDLARKVSSDTGYYISF